MQNDLLKISRLMAVAAIIFCSLATIIAYFSIDFLEPITVPLLVIGIFIWVLAVIWFFWGWLRNANEEGNELKGIRASSYILVFLPLCYCFLMATDEARTKIFVEVENNFKPIHSLKIYGSGSIFLQVDTLKIAGLVVGEKASYSIKSATSPHMKGNIFFEGFIGAQKFRKRIAGPFSIQPMRLKQDWEVDLDSAFFSSIDVESK